MEEGKGGSILKVQRRSQNKKSSIKRVRAVVREEEGG